MFVRFQCDCNCKNHNSFTFSCYTLNIGSGLLLRSYIWVLNNQPLLDRTRQASNFILNRITVYWIKLQTCQLIRGVGSVLNSGKWLPAFCVVSKCRKGDRSFALSPISSPVQLTAGNLTKMGRELKYNDSIRSCCAGLQAGFVCFGTVMATTMPN